MIKCNEMPVFEEQNHGVFSRLAPLHKNSLKEFPAILREELKDQNISFEKLSRGLTKPWVQPFAGPLASLNVFVGGFGDRPSFGNGGAFGSGVQVSRHSESACNS